MFLILWTLSRPNPAINYQQNCPISKLEYLFSPAATLFSNYIANSRHALSHLFIQISFRQYVLHNISSSLFVILRNPFLSIFCFFFFLRRNLWDIVSYVVQKYSRQANT